MYWFAYLDLVVVDVPIHSADHFARLRGGTAAIQEVQGDRFKTVEARLRRVRQFVDYLREREIDEVSATRLKISRISSHGYICDEILERLDKESDEVLQGARKAADRDLDIPEPDLQDEA